MRNLIGIPFKDRGRSIDGFDCYGLVMYIYKQKGIDIPDYFYEKANDDGVAMHFLSGMNNPLWQEDEIKKDNVVLFRIAGYIRHIGYMIDDKHFIHVLKGRNVTIESVEDTIWKNRVAGAYKWLN